MIYFDARLSQKYPTVEIRVADVCTDVEDALLVAALARGLVTRASPPTTRRSRGAASWSAPRPGGRPGTASPTSSCTPSNGGWHRPARSSTRWSQLARPALDEAGDRQRVDDLVEELFSRGTGATRQRRVFEKAGRPRVGRARPGRPDRGVGRGRA